MLNSIIQLNIPVNVFVAYSNLLCPKSVYIVYTLKPKSPSDMTALMVWKIEMQT